MECRCGIDEAIKIEWIVREALLLISTMALLTACGNDAQLDFAKITESAETMESVESDDESIKSNEVDITYEIYELFLNGELTVELEKEQVTIDKLFWNNDIEYCFGDIDGDGSEELHIRDDVMYYAIKARGGMQYIEYGGLFYSTWGNMGFHPCNVYLLEKGEFSEIGTGWIRENHDTEKEYFDYFWEGSLMTEEEYKECLNKLIDTSQCIRPEELYTKDEILDILAR